MLFFTNIAIFQQFFGIFWDLKKSVYSSNFAIFWEYFD